MKRLLKISLLMSFLATVAGCQSMSQPPLEPVDFVDLQRFMGDWYVIGNIPTFIEESAHNAVESYQLKKDGKIATTFRFREGSFEGELKTYHPTGYVTDHDSNGIWGMQFIWPIKADYRIVYLSDDYSQVIIARNKRDFVWIMARTPHIPEQDYQYMLGLIAEMGYNISQVRRVPQQWD